MDKLRIEDIQKSIMRKFREKSPLSNFQKTVGEWGDKTFNSKRMGEMPIHALGMYNHLFKEVFELRNALEQVFNPHLEQVSSVEEECADCFLLLLHLAHLFGFDLLKAATQKMEVNYKRKWKDPDEKGVIKHV